MTSNYPKSPGFENLTTSYDAAQTVDAMIRPSLRYDMPMAEYQSLRAMSAGMAIAMAEECPLRAWTDSPFNPDFVPENKQEFDIGTAAHLAVLEPEALTDAVVLHEYKDYKTNAAKEIRDMAWASGKTPLKAAEWALVAAISTQLAPGTPVGNMFQGGHPEVTLTWDWRGVPCKARPDYLAGDNSYIADLKTAISANPRAVARKAFAEGWYLRAAWYLAGVAEVNGRRPDHYWFVVVEKDSPFIAEVYELDSRAIAWGEQTLAHAIATFKECSDAGHWPGYCGKPTILSLPTYAEFQLAERNEVGEFKTIALR